MSSNYVQCNLLSYIMAGNLADFEHRHLHIIILIICNVSLLGENTHTQL